MEGRLPLDKKLCKMFHLHIIREKEPLKIVRDKKSSNVVSDEEPFNVLKDKEPSNVARGTLASHLVKATIPTNLVKDIKILDTLVVAEDRSISHNKNFYIRKGFFYQEESKCYKGIFTKKKRKRKKSITLKIK